MAPSSSAERRHAAHDLYQVGVISTSSSRARAFNGNNVEILRR